MTRGEKDFAKEVIDLLKKNEGSLSGDVIWRKINNRRSWWQRYSKLGFYDLVGRIKEVELVFAKDKIAILRLRE